MTQDLTTAYAVVDDVPILLGPERFHVNDAASNPDPGDDRYAEAYAEMAHYNVAAATEEVGDLDSSTSATLRNIGRLRKLPPEELARYPDPLIRWLDATYDVSAEADIVRFFSGVRGRVVLQMGGSGSGAIKLLLAGAVEAWLLSPMVEEIRLARALADSCGLADRLYCVAGVAEELPFASEVFDFIWASGTVHHTVTQLALPEAARVLKQDGRFGANEPWRAPGYSIGTRIFGKRETGTVCQPLTEERVAPLYSSFKTARVIHHGSLTRYALIALGKLHIAISLNLISTITAIDDRISSAIPGLRQVGSSVALVASSGRRGATPSD